MYLYFLSVLFVMIFASKDLDTEYLKEITVQDLKPSKAELDILALKSHQTECVEKTRVDPDLVVRFKAGDWKNGVPALKKWVLCVLHRLGLMSEEGVYKLDEALAKIHKKDSDKVEKFINECLPAKALPPSDIAWEYVKCLHFKDPHGNFSSISVFGLSRA